MCIAVRPGLITLTPAMQGSIMSAMPGPMNGTGKSVTSGTSIDLLSGCTSHFFFFNRPVNHVAGL